MKIKDIIIIICTVIFCSCEKLLDYDARQIEYNPSGYKPKLYVNAKFYADFGLKLYITSTQDISGKNRPDTIKRVFVRLVEGENMVIFSDSISLENSNANIWKSNFLHNPEEGANLQITIGAQGFESVFGSTKIPLSVPIDKIEVTNFYSGVNHFRFNTYFSDPVSSKNYYYFSSIYNLKTVPLPYSTDTIINTLRLTIPLSDPIFNFMPDFRTSMHEPFDNSARKPRIFPDDPISGISYNLRIEIPEVKESFYIQHPDYKYLSVYEIELYSISKEIFEAYKSLYMSEIIEGDIFAEPVVLYSNMSNNIGYFGAISKKSSKKVTLEEGKVLDYFNKFVEYYY